MSACDLQAAEAILAKLVARAYAADWPEQFGPRLGLQRGGEAIERQRKAEPGSYLSAKDQTATAFEQENESEHEWR